MSMIEKRRQKSGKTVYRVRAKHRDRTITSTFHDRPSAERFAAEASQRVRSEEHFEGEDRRNRKLEVLLMRYEKTVMPTKSGSHSQYVHIKYWRNRLGSMSIGKITRAVIAQCRDELSAPDKNGFQRAPATVKRYLACLSHVFTVAIGDWEWATDNPVRGVRKPKEPPGRVRYLSDQELEKLLEACRYSTSPDLYTVVLIALTTGMRRGEIMGLRWADVDLLQKTFTLEHTKNGSRRSVPMVDTVFNMLQVRAKVRRMDTPLLFPSDVVAATPKTPVPSRDLTKPWETARAKAGLVDFRFHDLRHSAASYMAMSGASLLDIAAVLGHKQIQMTKRYAHLSVDHLRGVLDRATQGVTKHV